MKSFKYRLEKWGLQLRRSLFLISQKECRARIRYLKQIVYAPPMPEPVFPAAASPFTACSGRAVVPRYRRAAIMASFCADCRIEAPLLFYLSELKKTADAVIFIADNPLIPNEAEKLLPLADFIQCERHGEYDFGSYKRGLAIAEKNGLLNEADQLVFCNDSCFGPFRPFQEFFNACRTADFCGMTLNPNGFRLEKNRLYLEDSPHIQSYFFAVSSRIFQRESFRQFFQSVRSLRSKTEIIIDYEQGLSRLLISEGFTPCTLFPAIEMKGGFLPKAKHKKWHQLVQKGFLLKKDIFRYPACFRAFNRLVKSTLFPFEIQYRRFVPRSSDSAGRSEKENRLAGDEK